MQEINRLISDTEGKLCEVINNSRLHPAITILILKNIIGQLHAIMAQAKTEENDADS